MIVNQKKEQQLEAVFKELNEGSDCITRKEIVKNKVSNLVLKAMQNNKKQIDCWNAFIKGVWSKAF